jgi:hypothetical protein
MRMFSLAIVYTPEGGRPLRAASMSDRSLLRKAVGAALRQAQREAETLAASDKTLGSIQAEETAKLRRVLRLLLALQC